MRILRLCGLPGCFVVALLAEVWASHVKSDQPPGRPALAEPAAAVNLFARTNLLAWCIVPFDARKRGPEERAAMLDRLGIRHFAYDWREEHVRTFDAEVEAMRRRGISLDAWWFPANLGPTSRRILEVLQRHGLKSQLWVTLGDPAAEASQSARVEAASQIIRPIAEEAAKIGCSVGLYNHGGWFGEPENQIAIIRSLRRANVGIVYNFHHGHDHIDRFRDLFGRMKPYLLAVNLNGMVRSGDRAGKKILGIGQGDQELSMLRVILESGWHGPVGIIDHREETDSDVNLRENLEGLQQLVARLKVESEKPAAAPPP